MRILGIAGSLRQDSFNAALLRAAGVERPEGTEFVVWDALRAVPPYDEDAEGRVPAVVAELKAAIAGADAVVFATPEYNASVPGCLKNAIDWVSRPFAANPLRGKPVLVVGTSTGMFGAVWAQAELRKVIAHLGADVIDEELPVILAEDRFEAGVLVDDDVREMLRERMTQLAGMVSEPQLLNAA
jgi:chromate reductase